MYWSHYAPLKCRETFTQWHSITSVKTWILSNTAIYIYIYIYIYKTAWSMVSQTANKYNSTPLIQMLVIHIANYTYWLGPACKFVENSTQQTCLQNYWLSDQVQYSVMASRTSCQVWSKVLIQVCTLNSNRRNSNCKCSLFSKKNPIIQIFCISRWLTVSINPDKWRSNVLCCIHSSTNGN